MTLGLAQVDEAFPPALAGTPPGLRRTVPPAPLQGNQDL